jgi:O-antigen/teichoic acid export membrane protein
MTRVPRPGDLGGGSRDGRQGGDEDGVAALVAEPDGRPELTGLEVLEPPVRPGLRARVAGSGTGQAAGLAGATLANNALQLVFTILVTRMLGSTDYGALAALISAFLILLVGGQAVQAAAAREVALGRLGDAGDLHNTVRAWTRTMLIGALALTVVGIAVRGPLASLIGTPEHPWGAAAILPTGALWLLISLQRGVLLGVHAFRQVGVSIVAEAAARLLMGGTLAAVAGVTGAFLGAPLAFFAVAVGLVVALDRRLGAPTRTARRRELRTLLSDGWVPIVGLSLLAVLQNVDVIVARHRLGEDRAGSYAVAAVAAKSVVWVAIGVGLQLLPQATRRAAAGQDPRPILYRALAVLTAVAAPALLIFALVPDLLLRTAFGPDTVDAAGALIVLGLAMTLLAVSYLTVQYLLALHLVSFLWVLGAIAAGEIVVLFRAQVSITGFASTVLATQAVAAVAVLVLAARARPLSVRRPDRS